MSALLLALFLLLAPPPAEGEMLRAAIMIETDAASLLPPEDGLRAGLARLFTAEFGRFIELSFDASAARGATGDGVQITLGVAGDMISVTSNLTRGSATLSMSSTVPRGCPASLLAAMAGDIAFLHFSSRDFTDLQLSPAPRLTGMIQTGALQAATGWSTEDLEPLSITQSGEDVVLCFPHAYLTLGPRFRLTTATLRDMHNQAVGREPLQLSGIVAIGATGADGADRLLLLSERQERIAVVNPRLGTRRVVEAPGLSGRGAQRLDAIGAADGASDGIAALSGDARALFVYSLSGGARRSIPVPGSYVSAFCRDREGNLWTWDSGERRVRILTPDGREVHSIKPLFSASAMPAPQEMGVCDDGGFLLAGYGEVWRFENTGIPVWRLARIPGRPGERLPPSFGLAVNGADGSFVILDAPSRRLLAFSPAPDGDAAPLAALLARLDGRKSADLEEASERSQSMGLSLMAWQYGDLLATAGGPETRRAEARIALLREKTMLYAELADTLARDLLHARADAAYLGAGEALRSLIAEVPGDPDATRLLQSVIGDRQEVRAALARQSDVRVLQADARATLSSQAERADLVIRLRLRNAATETLSRIRVHVSIPDVTPMPSLVEMEELAPDGERDVEVRCAGIIGALSGESLTAWALVTWERGGQSLSAAFTFPARMTDAHETPDPAAAIARRVLPNDALVRRLTDGLFAAAPSIGNELPAIAAILDALGGARAAALRAAPAATRDAESAAGTVPGLRAALRGLSTDETAWTLVTASIVGSFGVQPGLVSCRDHLYTLMDAGIPLSQAFAAFLGLTRYERLLSLLARNGDLWLPLSAAPGPTDGPSPTAWAAAEAVKALADVDDQEMRILWPLPPRAAAAPVPVPFPFELPVIPSPLSRDSLLGQVEAALGPR